MQNLGRKLNDWRPSWQRNGLTERVLNALQTRISWRLSALINVLLIVLLIAALSGCASTPPPRQPGTPPKELMGGRGYLSTEEYREAYRNGRITYQDLKRALRRVWFSNGDDPSFSLGHQQIHASDILILHLVHGIDGLIPQLEALGFATRRVFTDEREWFAVLLLERDVSAG